MPKQLRQYGTWSSPLSAASLSGDVRLNDVQWDADSHTLVWAENRGKQGILVAQTGADAPRDLTDELSVRGGVGYGGGEFTIHAGMVYFAANGRLYRQTVAEGSAKAITPSYGNVASPRVSPDGQWVAYIHTYEGVDGLALVDTEGAHWPRKLAFGTDFVMQPAWHPSGKQLAYIAWNHPQMPWDGTELRLLTLDVDSTQIPYVTQTQTLVGDTQTAVFQPEFSPDGRYLSYISDTTGFGQIYVYDLGKHTHTMLTDHLAEHGAPAWVQGLRMYGWTPDSQQLYYLRNEGGFYRVFCYDVARGVSEAITGLDDYTYLYQITVARDGRLAFIAGSSTQPSRIISHHPTDGIRIHRRASTEAVPRAALSIAQAITWKGHDGGDVHGLYYPPTNATYDGQGAPPLIVDIHGGPTSQRTSRYEASLQFFATRGYAVLSVNHRGSTGYGREYMLKLYHNWGVYDVEDAATGALYLSAQGLADSSKLVIMGGSAGGFTVLQSLVSKPGFYKAGICSYGISNQFMLVMDTHKFEEQYSFSLLGNLPDAASTYRERSPLFHADNIQDAVFLAQGDEDNVVPRSQSDSIVATLRRRGIPHEYHVYAGEGHGFRKPETIQTFYEGVLKFLTQYVLYA